MSTVRQKCCVPVLPCYETKFALARLLQPRSILEIGVRTGYSALAFLQAVPTSHYVGIDPNTNTHGGFHGAIEHARRLLAPYGADVHEMTSSEFAETYERGSPQSSYDLIHVDGDHSLEGCMFDLQLAVRIGFRHLLVDDYEGIKDVQIACDIFGQEHSSELTRIVINDGHNGAVLFTNNGEGKCPIAK